MGQVPARITDMRALGVLAPQSHTEGPTTPANVLATAVNAGQIDLSWTASTDPFGVGGYQIFRGGVPLNTTAATTYSDLTCQPSTTYSYVIVAFDTVGNNSSPSTASVATTPANAAPVWQAIPAQTLILGNAYSLDLTIYCTDADLDTLTFSLLTGALPSGITLSGSRLQGTCTTAGETPTVTLRAVDAFHQSDVTVTFATYTADITAPPVPAGVSATAVSGSQIDLTWVESIDVAGSADELVTGTQDYRVYRSLDGVTFSLRTTTTTPGYSDTGLSAAASYWYKITARDVALNESAQSTAATATTPLVDVSAPTVPTYLQATPQASAIQFSCDTPVDLDSGVTVLKLYEGATLRQTMTATASPVSYTQDTIGTVNPAPTFVRSGNSITISAEGVFVSTSTDNQGSLGRAITGDGVVTATVHPLTGAVISASKAGIQWSESNAPGAIRLSLHLRGDGVLRAQLRSTTNGPMPNIGTAVAITGSVQLRIERIGNSFTLKYRTSGNWIDIITQTIAMQSACVASCMVCSEVAGSVVSAQFDEPALGNTRFTFSQSTQSVGSSWSVSAVDASGNESAKSLAISADPIVSFVKWNPGIYVLSTGVATYSPTTLTQAATAGAKGWENIVYWNDIETSRGVYSGTFIDQLRADCASRGLRYILQPWYGAYSSNPATGLPAYLATEPNGGGGWYYSASVNGVFAKVWLPAIMDRFLALMQWVGQNYDADPIFEGIRTGESALPSEATTQTDYTYSGYLTQYTRMITLAPTYFPTTNVWISLNFGFNQQDFPGLLAAMAANRCGMCGPDVYTSNADHSTNGDRACRGLVYSSTQGWIPGGIDYRGKIPIQHDWQGPEMGGKEGSPSLDTLLAFDVNTNGSNHSAISAKDRELNPARAFPDDLYWSNTMAAAVADPEKYTQDIKSWIPTAGPTVTAKPSVYSSVLTGGT